MSLARSNHTEKYYYDSGGVSQSPNSSYDYEKQDLSTEEDSELFKPGTNFQDRLRTFSSDGSSHGDESKLSHDQGRRSSSSSHHEPVKFVSPEQMAQEAKEVIGVMSEQKEIRRSIGHDDDWQSVSGFYVIISKILQWLCNYST